jgi:hypothetical protein
MEAKIFVQSTKNRFLKNLSIFKFDINVQLTLFRYNNNKNNELIALYE